MQYFGYASLMGILLMILSIGLSWWVIQNIRLDIFLKKPSNAQAKLLQIILSVIMGYNLAKFFLDYLGWSIQLRNIF